MKYFTPARATGVEGVSAAWLHAGGEAEVKPPGKRQTSFNFRKKNEISPTGHRLLHSPRIYYFITTYCGRGGEEAGAGCTTFSQSMHQAAPSATMTVGIAGGYH